MSINRQLSKKLFNNSESSQELEKIIQVKPLFGVNSRAIDDKKGEEFENSISGTIQ